MANLRVGSGCQDEAPAVGTGLPCRHRSQSAGLVAAAPFAKGGGTAEYDNGSPQANRAQVGISDKHHFRRSFQPLYGVCPAEYRQREADNRLAP